MAFASLIFCGTQLLSGLMWGSSIPNFTQNGRYSFTPLGKARLSLNNVLRNHNFLSTTAAPDFVIIGHGSFADTSSQTEVGADTF
jgi:hypothetical protein